MKLSKPKVRIIDGVDSKIEEFPFIVALEFSDGPSFTCGGSILSSYYVITAAHCVEDESADELQVRAGSSFRVRRGSVHRIRNFTIHPERYARPKDYDLAILQLIEPIELDGKTKESIPMFESGEESKNGTTATVIGLGCIDVNETVAPNQLQSINMTILDKSTCWSYIVRERRICTLGRSNENKTRGICSGDSGGPLVIRGRLAGVVSSTNNVTLPINIFTEVSRYRKWIDKTMKVTVDNEENDDNFAIKEFPYLVSVEYSNYHHLTCGGTIVSPWFIVTAASCFDDALPWQVRAGSSFEEEFGSIHRVRNVTIHPDYARNKARNNLAVVLLENPIEIDNKTKKAITMFESNEVINKGSDVKTAGWGCPIEDKSTLAKQLRSLKMKFIDEKTCKKFYDYTYNKFNKGDLCTANVIPGKSYEICYKDTGNPLVVDGKLAGIVYYRGRSYADNPNKFLEIAHYRKWIDKSIEALGAIKKYFEKKREAEDAAIKKVPYLVALEFSAYKYPKFICCGAIVSPNYIITAARCAGSYAAIYQVRVGSSFKERGGTVLKVSKFIVQDKLALVKLKTSIEINNKTISSISIFDQESKDGSIALTAGWDCINKNKTDAKLLQNLNMTIVGKEKCQERYKKGFSFELGLICASFLDSKITGICNSITGNILVINGRLAGIKTYHFEFYGSRPNKFIEVANYRSWISETLKP